MKPSLLTLALGAILTGCGQDPVQSPIARGGNGSETTNGFTFLVINQDGTPAADVLVHIRPSDSMAGRWGDSLVGTLRTRLDTVSDAEGHVDIDGLVRGNYTVELRQRDIRRLAHQSALPERPFGGQFKLIQAGTPRFTDMRLAGCELTLFGVDRKATVNLFGSVQFDSLPQGTYSFRAWKNGKRLGDGTFRAETGTTATLLSFDYWGSSSDPAAFRHASVISINTNVSNANVQSTFAGFAIPLDLNQDNFEFSGASPLAMKFVSPSGATLPYEIESWDATTRKARLWLRLDTLKGLQDHQMVQMYWGGSPQSSVGQIFDTADGWWGTWHLRQNLKDVTPYRRTATGSQAGVDGWSSNGMNTLVFPGLPDQTDSGFTVSLWVLPDTGQRASAPILRQIPSDATVSPFSLRMGPFSTWIEAHYPNGNGAKVSQFPTVSAPGEWLQIAVTYDRKRDAMQLYLNGKPWGDIATALNATGLKMNGTLVLGGSDSAGVGFKGLVKEVRLSTVPRSADWINAEYNIMAPKSNSEPIVFQRLR